jgi:hypothetical protein
MASSISITQTGGTGITAPPLTVSNIFQVNTGAGRTGANVAAASAVASVEG